MKNRKNKKKQVFGVSVDRVSVYRKNIYACSKQSWNRRKMLGAWKRLKVPGMSGQQILCSIHRNTQPSELPQRIFDDKRGQPDCVSLQNVPNVPCPICPCLIRDTSHSVAFCRRLIPWSHVILTCHDHWVALTCLCCPAHQPNRRRCTGPENGHCDLWPVK